MPNTQAVTDGEKTNLLTPMPGGAYYRPYATRIIEVSFLSSRPVYTGDYAFVNDYFATGAEGGDKFSALTLWWSSFFGHINRSLFCRFTLKSVG